MSIENKTFNKLREGIEPIVSIGVGSAICRACLQLGVVPQELEPKHLPELKKILLAHYEKLWAGKLESIRSAIGKL